MKKSNKNGSVNHYVTEKMKGIDLFANKVELKAEGKVMIGSVFGSWVSLFIYVLILTYTSFRL